MPIAPQDENIEEVFPSINDLDISEGSEEGTLQSVSIKKVQEGSFSLSQLDIITFIWGILASLLIIVIWITSKYNDSEIFSESNEEEFEDIKPSTTPQDETISLIQNKKEISQTTKNIHETEI